MTATLVDTTEKFADLLVALHDGPRVIGFDSETTGLDFFGKSDRRPAEVEEGWGPARICGVSLALTATETFYLPFRHESDEPQLPLGCLGALVEAFEGKALVMHNAKFEMRGLGVDGFRLNRTKTQIHDTILLAHVLNEDRDSFTLETLTRMELGIVSPFKRAQWDAFRKRRLRRFSQFTAAESVAYASDDAANTLLLWHHLYPNLVNPSEPWWGDETQQHLYDEEIKLSWALFDMEMRGIKIDLELTRKLRDGLAGQRVELHHTIDAFVGPTVRTHIARKLREHEDGCAAAFRGSQKGECSCPVILAPFLVSSHPQMITLFNARGWPVPRDPENPQKLSFTDDLLKRLAKSKEAELDPNLERFIDLVGQYRKAAKQQSYYDSYLKLADDRGFLHPTFNQHGTVTGRLSCEKPNMQQIPKDRAGTLVAALGVEAEAPDEVRTVFIPADADHCFVTFDYSQQEVRMLAHYAKDPGLIALLTDRATDIHATTAAELFGKDVMAAALAKHERDETDKTWETLRFYAKSVVFGIMYGMGKPKLARTMSLEQPVADRYWEEYMARFPGVPVIMALVKTKARVAKHVRNWFGRRRRMHQYTPEELSMGYMRRRAGYTHIREGETIETHRALNSLIQGGCADLTKQAMLRCVEVLHGTRSLLVNTVHDDLLFEVHKDEVDELVPRLREALEKWVKVDGSPQFRVPFYTDGKIGAPGAPWSEVTTKLKPEILEVTYG